MFSAETHIRKIGETEHGAARLAAIADAIREADQASAHEWRFYFRYEAVRESIFHDDAFKAILSFPELLKIYDDHPELEDEYADDMLCAFKWVLENMTHFYQISREQIDANYDEYVRRCRQYGVSLRVYHMKRCNYLLTVDMDAARAEYDAFHKCRRDGYSDCEACEIHFDMTVALALDEEAEALRIAKPLLDGSKHCGEIPHYTYAKLTEYYLYAGDLEEAAYYGELCERLMRGDPEFLDATGTLLALYSATDPSHGWNLFKQCLPQYMASKNPRQRMEFADGAYRLMQTLCAASAENGSDDLSRAPVLKCLPLPMTEEGMHLCAVRDYFYNAAHDAGKRLDARNGATYFAERLSRVIIPTDQRTGLTDRPARKAHGITRRIPCVLFASLPEDVEVTYQQMEQRVRGAVPEETELVSCSVDEEGLFLSYRRDDRVYDYALGIVSIPDAPSGTPVEDLDDAAFAAMCRNPRRYILRCHMGSNPQLDYHYAMELLHTVLPELIGVIDLMNRHAYSADWVRFKGLHDASVSPNDLFGLYLTGDRDLDEVWMTTTGMNVLGMRELEVIGADTRNFSKFADILDHIAAQVTDRGILPDEGERFGTIYLDDEPYEFAWRQIPDFGDAKGIAAQAERELPCGELLLDTDEGLVPLPDCACLANAGNISYPNSRRDFYRRIELAKQTFGYFRDALEKPFVRAAVQLEFHLSEEMRKEYGYGIELLWAEITQAENGCIRAAVKETAETLPEIHEDDIVTVDGECVTAWFIQPEGAEQPISAQDAYYLAKEVQA